MAPTDSIEIATLLRTRAVGRGRPGVSLARHPSAVGTRWSCGLLDTGIRVSELCGLGLGDVDRERELAHVTGEGSRARTVPSGAKTDQAIERHLQVRALPPYANSPRLLLGLRGPMTTDGAREVLNVRSAQAGLGWAAYTRTGSGTPSPTAGWPAVGGSETQ